MAARGVNIRVGAQHTDACRALNPTGLGPTLGIEGHGIGQSLAIIDRLERLQSEPPLWPADGAARGSSLEIACLVACDIHPLNNLRVLKQLTGPLALSDAQKHAWYAHWITTGFDALELLLLASGDGCVGSAPTLADVCLVPQVANARRMAIDLEPWPRIRRIHAQRLMHAAMAQAATKLQPDHTA